MGLPKIVDLFSGCGGLTLGFLKAGFHVAAGIELMPEACRTLESNCYWRYGVESSHFCGDITKISVDSIKNKIDDDGCIVIGGPPCQAYSLAGRAKLKSLGEDRINVKDSRGYLYQDFLRFVEGLNPKAVVMENVPESTDYGGINVPDEVCNILSEKGYQAYWTILNSADYGVPQIRERVFVIAVRKDVYNGEMILPQPTNVQEDGNLSPHQRRLAKYENNRYFKTPTLPTRQLPNWVTVEQAFSDLPKLKATLDTPYRKYELNVELPYRTIAMNDFQKEMRRWFGEDLNCVTGNAYRRNDKDFQIFERMKAGDTYLEAVNIAMDILKDKARQFDYSEDSEEYKKLKKKIVPVYSVEKFLNKWKRLDARKPSHTVVAHLCCDTYSHIHPWEARGVSVREAARLQSFPDDFFFTCSMGDAFKQIGNAVPPLLAYGIAKTIRLMLI